MDLDETSATGLLLDLLNKGHNAKISKDKEFYLGACTEDADANVQLVRKRNIGVCAWYHGSFGLTIIRIYLDVSPSRYKWRSFQGKHVDRYDQGFPSGPKSAGELGETLLSTHSVHGLIIYIPSTNSFFTAWILLPELTRKCPMMTQLFVQWQKRIQLMSGITHLNQIGSPQTPIFSAEVVKMEY